ncbi:hypothetical protein D3C83_241670 [compost metagenome]
MFVKSLVNRLEQAEDRRFVVVKPIILERVGVHVGVAVLRDIPDREKQAFV